MHQASDQNSFGNLCDSKSSGYRFHSSGASLGLAEGNQILHATRRGWRRAMYLFKIAVTLLVMAAAIRLTPYYRRLRYGLHIANLVLAFVVTINLLQLFVL